MAEQETKHMTSRPIQRKRKVKTGCKTCKARRVKCDEGWPACRVCVSTGRVCDGYGLWGGGGNRYEQRTTKICPPPAEKSNLAVRTLKLPSPRYLMCGQVSFGSNEEELHFEFFKTETAPKLPGSFGSDFWTFLIIQVCYEEPAVLHAALAISAAHRRKYRDAFSRCRALKLPDKQEEFMLRHYCKSIEHLQPKFQLSGTQSVRTALIACLIFVYLEFLRGNYEHACEHVRGGMSLVRELCMKTPRTKLKRFIAPTHVVEISTPEELDEYLVDAFIRVQIHVEYAGQRFASRSKPVLAQPLPAFKFCSHNEARHYLDKIFQSIGALNEVFRHGAEANWPDEYRKIIATDQHLTEGVLDTWTVSYNATIADIAVKEDVYDSFGYRMLRLYHLVADIMVSTCASPDQCVYDSHAAKFASIVTQAEALSSAAESFGTFNKPHMNDGWLDAYTCKRKEWIDDQWVAPLYYTAIKCRDHRIRTRALRLMERTWCRDEGLQTWLFIAQEVMKSEEGGFFDRAGGVGDELLPEQSRFDSVRTKKVVRDDGSRFLQIECRKDHGRVRVVKRTYEWRDGGWIEISSLELGETGVEASAAAVEQHCLDVV